MSDLMEHFTKIKKANVEGYAGMLPNGNLVDRREQPEGYPIEANSLMGITAPRCIRCNSVVGTFYLTKSLCPDCRDK